MNGSCTELNTIKAEYDDGAIEIPQEHRDEVDEIQNILEVSPYSSMVNETIVAEIEEEYSTTISPNPSSIINDIEDIGEVCMSLRMENEQLKEELGIMKKKVERLETAITKVFEDIVETD